MVAGPKKKSAMTFIQLGVITVAVLAIGVAVVFWRDLMWTADAKAGFDLFKSGNLAASETKFKSATKWAEGFSERDIRLPLTLNTMAEIYMAQGRYAEAEEAVRRSLSINEKIHGIDSCECVGGLGILAGLYRRQGQYKRAMEIYDRVLPITEKCEGENFKHASMLNTVAKLKYFQGDYKKAEELYQRANKIRLDQLTKGKPDDAEVGGTTLDGLGDMEEYHGHYATAEKRYKEAFALGVKFGSDAAKGSSMACLSNLQLVEGKYDDALDSAQKALEYFGHSKGIELLKAADMNSTTNEALVFIEKGRLADAEKLLGQAQTIALTRLGPKHPGTAWVLSAMAKLEQKQGKKEEAIKTEKTAVGILNETLGPQHRWVAREQGNLAEIYRQQADTKSADPLYKTALSMAGTVMPPEHPDRAFLLTGYAKLTAAKGNEKEAKSMEAEAKSIMAKAMEL